jgi:uncharacterized membrane protein YcaP (DUF421 family)
MFHLAIPWSEFLIRAVCVYLFLLIALRTLGKKQTAQMTPFDFVLLLIVSNAVQNAMNGGDNSLIGGIFSAAVLMLLNYFISWAVFKSKRLEDIIEGKPEFIVQKGKVNYAVMKSEYLTQMDLDAAIRQFGCETMDEVEWAVLENNGMITVKKKC